MKKIILLSALMLSSGLTVAQNKPGAFNTSPIASTPGTFAPNATITQGFDTVGNTTAGCSGLTAAGWVCINRSGVTGTSWFNPPGVGTIGMVAPNPAAQSGAAGSMAASDFTALSGAAPGIISNWIISPVVQYGNGSQLEFYFRSITNAAGTAQAFADRLQVRLSTVTTAPSAGATPTSVGDFTTLLADFNSTYTTGLLTCGAAGLTNPTIVSTAAGFPASNWCKITIDNAGGLPTTGSGRIAFRYFVESGGSGGNDSAWMAIDTFSFIEGGGVGATIVAGTPVGAVTIPPRTLPTASATATLSFTASSASSTTCVATGAGYSVAPSPLTLPANTAVSVTVTQSSTVAGTYLGTVTCTNAAGATPASFAYNFTHVVSGAAIVLTPTPALNLWGAFALLAGLGLFGAFAVRRFS